jgi:hypothetical protein
MYNFKILKKNSRKLLVYYYTRKISRQLIKLGY